MRRIGHILMTTLLWSLVGIGMLGVLAANALRFKPVRRLVSDRVLAAVRGSLRGELYVDDWRWPSLNQLELSGVSLHDRNGTPVLTLPSVIVRLQLHELLRGRVVIPHLELDHPYVDFAAFGDDAGLLSMFGSDEPKPAQPKPPSSGDFSPIAVRIEQLCLASGQVALQPDAARQLLFSRLEGCAQLNAGETLSIALDALRGELQNQGEIVLELVPRDELPALADAAAEHSREVMRLGLGGRFSMRQDFAFDAYLQLRDLAKPSLDALRVNANWLHAPLQLDAHAHASGKDIAFHVDAQARTSRARLQGMWTEAKLLTAELHSEHLELRHVSDAQLDPLRFELDARADLSSPVLDLRAKLRRAWLGTLPLPTCALHATRDPNGTIALRSFEARHGAARLTAQGQLAADGGIRAQAELAVSELADVPLLERSVQGLSGALAGTLHFERAPAGAVSAELALSGRSLQLQGNAAGSMDLALRAGGVPQRPALNAQLHATQLTLGQERIAEASLGVSGGPERYDVHASAADHDLALSGWLKNEQAGWSGGFELGAVVAGERVQASLTRALFAPDAELLIEKLRAQYMDARLFADGRVALGDHPEHSSLRFGSSVPELATLTRKFLQRELPGRIEAVGCVQGELKKPAVEARVRWMNGPLFAKHESELALYARADLADGHAEANLQASAGDAHVEAKLDSHWRKDQALVTALKSARHDLTLTARSIAVEALAQSSDQPAPLGLRGLLGGQLEVHGNQHKLQLDTSWQAELRAGRDPNALSLELRGNYDAAKLGLTLTASDQQGKFLDFAYAHQLNLQQLMAAARPFPELARATTWQTHAHFAKRRVSELPLVRGLGLDRELAPLTVATDLRIDQRSGQQPEGEWKTDLRWEPASSGEAELAPCSLAAKGGMTLDGKLAGGEVAITLTAQTGHGDVARVETALHARLEDVLANRYDQVGLSTVTAELRELDLGKLPVICERGKGVVSAQLNGKDLFARAADFDMKLDGKALEWDHSPALEAHANAHSEGDNLAVRARVKTGDGELGIDGALPIGFRGKNSQSIVNREGPVALSTRWNKVELASLLAYVPGVALASGRLDGAIDVGGTLQHPDGRGSLAFKDVSFTLPRLGQRFAHLNLKAAVDDHQLRLSEAKFRDLDGSASAAAQLTLEQPQAWSAELNLNVRNFPVRKSGVMMGRADADVKVIAKTNASATDVQVKLANVAIKLTTSDIAAVQSLDPDPEIQFIDALSTEPAPKPRDQSEQTATRAPIQIGIESTEPIWVRRDDFSVQMNTQLRIKLAGGTPDMTGKIDLIRGYISLLGTNFDIKGGRVTFTGSEQVDPQLEITAESSTPSGNKVRLEVTGFVQAPKLAFFLNGDAVTAGDAIAQLSGVGDASGGKGAEEQLASAAIGMTAGLLSLGARRELGDWVPMLSIEQGAQTRLRVGFEAHRLIPNFMRGFVRGVYVEGIVASGENNADPATVGAETNTASGAGVMLELMLPKNLLWAGQFGPGDAWSVDLDWRP